MVRATVSSDNRITGEFGRKKMNDCWLLEQHDGDYVILLCNIIIIIIFFSFGYLEANIYQIFPLFNSLDFYQIFPLFNMYQLKGNLFTILLLYLRKFYFYIFYFILYLHKYYYYIFANFIFIFFILFHIFTNIIIISSLTYIYFIIITSEFF